MKFVNVNVVNENVFDGWIVEKVKGRDFSLKQIYDGLRDISESRIPMLSYDTIIICTAAHTSNNMTPVAALEVIWNQKRREKKIYLQK